MDHETSRDRLTESSRSQLELFGHKNIVVAQQSETPLLKNDHPYTDEASQLLPNNQFEVYQDTPADSMVKHIQASYDT